MQQHHHHHQQHGDLVSLASGGGENPVPAGPPVPPAEPHVSAALVGDVPGAPQACLGSRFCLQLGQLNAGVRRPSPWWHAPVAGSHMLLSVPLTCASTFTVMEYVDLCPVIQSRRRHRPDTDLRRCDHSRLVLCVRTYADDSINTRQVGEIQSVGDGGFALPAVHSQFTATAAMEPPQPSISEHASVGDAFGGGDMDAV